MGELFLNWRKSPGLRVAIAAAAIFCILGLVLTLNRYYTFFASYDQGIFNQVFWNGLHGNFFESSLSSVLSSSVVHDNKLPEVFYHRLGQHFTPALLLWLPIYALFPSPATLAGLQVVLVTAAGLVLYALARHYLEPPLSAMITVSFYGANAVVGPTLGNFHDICQLPLFIFSLLLAMEKRWWWLFSILVVCILAVREDAGVSLFGIGVYLTLSRRYPKLGLGLCSLSFLYMVALTNWVMPLFSDDISRRFMLERFGQYVDGDEATTLQILWAILSDPVRLVRELLTPFGRKFNYLLGQLLPLGFIPVISPPAWPIAGFPLLQIFLQRGQSPLGINIRYAMTIVPGLFYGAILWWSQHQSLFKLARWRRLWAVCIGLSLFFTSISNPNRTLYFIIPDSVQPWVYTSLPRQWHHIAQARPLLAEIPPDASVSATTYLVPPLSSRRAIIRFPRIKFRNDENEPMPVDYVAADLWQLQQYQVAFRHERSTIRDGIPVLDEVIDSGEYGVVGFADGVMLLQHNAPSDPAAEEAWRSLRPELETAPDPD